MKIKMLCAILLATVMLCGCSKGSNDTKVDIDPAAAAQTLVEEGGFVDTSTLTPIPDALLESYYALGDTVAEYAIYIDGSGGTAREVAVLKVADTAKIADARAVIDKRLETLKREFENYRPDEMQKINNPLIVEKGNVVYLVLSDDSQKAEQAINSLYVA